MSDRNPFDGKVAAVFVTMNRRETARTCLEKLAAQTVKPSRVFVANNASTDGTRSMLEEIGKQTDGWLVLMDLPENLGNAGGIQIAMEAAFSAGCQAAWILDDDSWPEPEALERLLAADLPPDAVRSSRVVDLATGALSWPLQIPDGEQWRLVETHDPLPPGEVVRIRRSWLGALVPREVYESVGQVDGRLFLRGEDEDYPRRIERAGFPIFMVSGSLLHHPPSGRLNRWTMFGRELVLLERGLGGDKLYYRLRNAWWLARRDHSTSVALAAAGLNFLSLLRWERPIRAWLPVWKEAFVHAWRGRLGKR